jgi:hypothetical protein
MAETLISPGVFTRENDISFIQPAPVEAGAAIIGPTVKGPVEIPTIVTSYNDYVRKFGATFESGSGVHEFFTSMAVKNYFQQGGNTCLVTRVVSGSFTEATNTNMVAEDAGADPFVIKTIGRGTIYNNPNTENSDGSLISGSDDNLRWEISNIDTAKGTFNLIIRRGNDSRTSKVVLETFNNVNLDPNSTNYIERVVGNQYSTIASDGSQVYTTGSYVNNSNYVYISSVARPTLNYLGNDGQIRIGSLSGSLPTAQSGSFTGAVGGIKDGANLYHSINSSNTQGLVAGDYSKVITLLENKDDYRFNIVTAPGIYNTDYGTTVDSLISLVETRGDAIAVVDLVAYGKTVTQANTEAADLNSSYGAAYWPWLQTQAGNSKVVWAPASVFIPGTYAFTDNSSAPWFAPAGLVRGGLTGAIQAEKKLTRSDRDSLYSSKVNPIATFPGTGLAVFGQKTLQSKASALDRVNVRRLLIELKEFIGNQADSLVFEQNTLTTRNRFLAAVNPYLESVVQRQGLYAYRVVMDDTNNTADVIDRNQLVGQIFIQPAKTAEFIILDFVVEPTGATFGA